MSEYNYTNNMGESENVDKRSKKQKRGTGYDSRKNLFFFGVRNQNMVTLLARASELEGPQREHIGMLTMFVSKTLCLS